MLLGKVKANVGGKERQDNIQVHITGTDYGVCYHIARCCKA